MIWRCDSAAVSVWVDKIMCCWWRPEFAVQHLGFGGAEGKEIRDLLMKKLKGNSAFRTEANKQRWQEARRNEREAAKRQEQAPAEQQESEHAEVTADAALTEQVSQSSDTEE